MLFGLLVFITSSFANFSLTEPPKKASDVFVTLNKNGDQISLQDLSQVRVSDFELVSGKKMNVADKISFKIAQRELRQAINTDGTLNGKQLNKIANKMADGSSGFNIGGFALGFLLSLIGVLIAYVISDDEKAARTKWAWIGFAVSLALGLLFALI